MRDWWSAQLVPRANLAAALARARGPGAVLLGARRRRASVAVMVFCLWLWLRGLVGLALQRDSVVLLTLVTEALDFGPRLYSFWLRRGG